MPVRFLFAIHNHQPVGNFDWVMDRCVETGYRPFLDVLERHPGVRVAIHTSGPLLEFFERAHPDLIDRMAALVDRGQMEPIAGGFHEPILPIIPPDDAVGQIERMRDWIRRRFGVDARGLWLTERVWEPSLPSVLARAGIRFTLVDDTQFLYEGVAAEDARGWWRTEDLGRSVALFPIDMRLRYLVPFRPVAETIDYFRSLHDAPGDAAVTLGDDGEKFGVWPDTFRYVYENGYLEDLFTALEENADWLHTCRFDEELDRSPPIGRIYLSTASYEEMMEWVLPTPARSRFENLLHEVKGDAALYDRLRPHLRGGNWRGYLAKYPEADRIHKRMLRASRRLAAFTAANDAAASGDAAALGDAVAEARDALWRGQCNCGYWHGLFGGLYLGHLRDALLHNLARCERIVEETSGAAPPWRIDDDFDRDGRLEILLHTGGFRCLVDPDADGAVVGLDVVGPDIDLANVLARRSEAYHGRVATAEVVTGEGDAPASIHNLDRAKEPGLERLLVQDPAPRAVFQERWIDPATARDPGAFEAWRRAEMPLLSPVRRAWTADPAEGAPSITLNAVVPFSVGGDENGPRIRARKTYRAGDRGELETRWEIEGDPDRPIDVVFAVDANLTMLSPIGPRHWLETDGHRTAPAEPRNLDCVRRVQLADAIRGVAVDLVPSPSPALWAFPVETVSSSESGFERTYQGTCLTFRWGVNLQPGGLFRCGIRLESTLPAEVVAGEDAAG